MHKAALHPRAEHMSSAADVAKQPGSHRRVLRCADRLRRTLQTSMPSWQATVRHEGRKVKSSMRNKRGAGSAALQTG